MGGWQTSQPHHKHQGAGAAMKRGLEQPEARGDINLWTNVFTKLVWAGKTKREKKSSYRSFKLD